MTALQGAARHAPMLEADEERALASRARDGDAQATEALLRSHFRLVLTIAHQFSGHGLPLEDLVSEGILGLVEAARRFEPEREVRLAAYAAWWIRAYIRRYTIANRRMVRAPSSRSGRKLLAKLRKTQRDLAQQNGEMPDAALVASALDVQESDVVEMEAALSGKDVPTGHAGEQRSLELADSSPSPEDLFAEQEERQYMKDAIARAMDLLTERERHILSKRYLEDERISLASIGRDMGLSRERVRQLEHQAHTKLRQAILHSAA